MRAAHFRFSHGVVPGAALQVRFPAALIFDEEVHYSAQAPQVIISVKPPT